MCKLAPLVWSKLAVALLAVAGAGCDALVGSESTFTLKGDRYAYAIPMKYQKGFSSILYPGAIEGDDSASTLLLLKVEDSESDSEFELSLLLFHDRSYTLEDFLGSAVESAAQKSVKFEKTIGLYQYRRDLGGTKYYYYFSFSPSFSAAKTISEADFKAQFNHGPGLNIRGGRTVSKPSCEILSIRDGILIQATVVHDFCSPGNLRRIKEIQDAVMNSWRQTPAHAETASTPTSG